MLNMTDSANIIINTEKSKALFLRLETRQECALVPLVQHSIESSSCRNKTGERNKRNLNLKGRSNTVNICR